MSRIAAAALAAAALLAAQAPGAGATVPGANGRLAFTLAGRGILTIAPDGSGRTALQSGLPAAGWSIDPAWSPDGSVIAYTLSSPRPQTIWLMNADGSAPRLVGEGMQPAWSPDGTRIAFARVQVRGRQRTDLWVMNADGTGAVDLTGAGKPGDSTVKDLHPAWSPDGARIAFESNRGGNVDVYAVPAAGGQAIRLTDDPAQDATPAFSPDGRTIAFVHGSLGTVGSVRSLWAMDANGSHQRRLWSHAEDESSPVFSPDGTRMAYVKSLPSSHVFTAALDGTDERDLAADEGFEQGLKVDWAAVPRRPSSPVTPAGKVRRLSVSRRTVTASRSGRVRVRVACPAGRRTCSGRLRLLAVRRVRCRAGVLRRGQRLGSGAYVVPSGRTARVTVRLARKPRRVLACARRVRVRAVAKASDRVRGTSSALLVVRAPRRR